MSEATCFSFPRSTKVDSIVRRFRERWFLSKVVTIVIADDHKLLRYGLKMLLETETDFKVVGEAVDGPETVKMVTELQPDILITDLRMPGVDGIQVARQVSRSSPKTRVIILPLYGDDSYVSHAIEAGARGYILKGSDSEEIINAVRAVVRGENYLGSPISLASIKAYRQQLENHRSIHQ